MRQAGVGAVLLLAVACASAPPRPASTLAQDLARADARLLDGCYDCLIEARDRYAALAEGGARATVLPRLFEAQVLIVARQRELAIASDLAMEEARRLAGELPRDAGADRVLAALDVIPENSFGIPERETDEFRRAHGQRGREIAADPAALEVPAVRDPARRYLLLALRCAYVVPRRAPSDVESSTDDPPLLTYRRALCGTLPDGAALERLLTVVPGFVETLYARARLALASVGREGPRRTVEATALARTAAERFPDSPAVTQLLGTIRQVAGDCVEAIAEFDRTLARRPGHQSAMLGRVACLSRLGRHEDAIAEATALIALETSVQRDAYYWRAWNRHQTHRFTDARADIEQARALGVSVEIATLAGIIEYDQSDLAPARRDLRAALALSDRACTAAWYLALVDVAEQAWSGSAAAFESAANCYRTNVEESRAGLAAVEVMPDLDAVFRAQQIAGFRAVIDEDTGHYHAAALNAAKSFALADRPSDARRLAAVVAGDSTLAAELEVLRQFLDGADPR